MTGYYFCTRALPQTLHRINSAHWTISYLIFHLILALQCMDLCLIYCQDYTNCSESQMTDFFKGSLSFFLFPVEFINAVWWMPLRWGIYSSDNTWNIEDFIKYWCLVWRTDLSEYWSLHSLHIQSTANFDLPWTENGAASSQSGYPKNQECTTSSLSKNFKKTLAELVKVVPGPFRIPPFSSTVLHPILHMFIDNDCITVQSWFMSKAGPLSALKKDYTWGWR